MAELGPVLPRSPSYSPPPMFLAKGHYFTISGRTPFQHLVYPVPVDGGLGTHLTLDMNGRARFGPDVQWVDRIDYAFDDPLGVRRTEFEHAIRRYWPALPDMAQSSRVIPAYDQSYQERVEPARDFAIDGAETHGIPRMVALYGIESPGLTCQSRDRRVRRRAIELMDLHSKNYRRIGYWSTKADPNELCLPSPTCNAALSLRKVRSSAIWLRSQVEVDRRLLIPN